MDTNQNIPDLPPEVIEGLKAKRIPVSFTVDMVGERTPPTFNGSISAWDAWAMLHGSHPQPAQITVDVDTIDLNLDSPKPADEKPMAPTPHDVGEALLATAFCGSHIPNHEKVVLLQEARAWLELARKIENEGSSAYEKKMGTTAEVVGEALLKIIRATERAKGHAV